MPPMLQDTVGKVAGWPLYPQGRRRGWQGRRAFEPTGDGKGAITPFPGRNERHEMGVCPALMIQKGLSVQPIQTKARGLEGPAREERAGAVGLLGSSVELTSRHPLGVRGPGLCGRAS